jgi:hypothetical protein
MTLGVLSACAQVPDITFAPSLEVLFCPDGPIRTVGFRSNGQGQRPDLVVASGNANGTMHVLSDFDDAAYAQTTAFEVGAYGVNTLGSDFAVHFAMGDLNGDGDEDVVVYWNRWNWYIPQQLFALLTIGAGLEHHVLGGAIQGNFEDQFRYRVELFDVNGDGRMDLVLPGSRVSLMNPSIAFGNDMLLGQQPDGSFAQTTAQLPPATYARHRDINADGLEDVFRNHGDFQSITYLNQGGGSFVPADTNDVRPANNAWVDFNEDGIADVVFGGATSDNISVVGFPVDNASIGTQQLLFSTSIPGNEFWKTARLADLNMDGHADIIAKSGSASPNSQLYQVAAGDGSWPNGSPLQTILQCDQPRFLLEDIDADGDLDLIVYDGNCIYWLENLRFEPVAVQALGRPTIGLHPVPASDHIVVRTGEVPTEGSGFEIRDIHGRMVATLQRQLEPQVIPVGNLPAGAYFLHITDLTNMPTRVARFIISR